MTLGNFRAIDSIDGRDQHRSAPAGIPMNSINWLCEPGDLGQKWTPSPAQLVTSVCGGEGDHGYRESRFQPASTTHCGVQERAHRVGPSSSSSCPGRCFSCCGGGFKQDPDWGNRHSPMLWSYRSWPM